MEPTELEKAIYNITQECTKENFRMSNLVDCIDTLLWVASEMSQALYEVRNDGQIKFTGTAKKP